MQLERIIIFRFVDLTRFDDSFKRFKSVLYKTSKQQNIVLKWLFSHLRWFINCNIKKSSSTQIIFVLKSICKTVIQCRKCNNKEYTYIYTPSNKIPTVSKSINMDIWVVGTSDQLFVRGSQTGTRSL